MKKIAVYNIKGGVGKTTTSVNLACFLAKSGLSVLLWDLDPQGGSSYFFNRQNHNNNTHARLFNQYITIYDVIHSTDSYQIDVISNDSLFSDQFVNQASRMAVVNFENFDLLKVTLKEVEDDYDVCIMDCSPGRFTTHDNIFQAADLVLVPNTPAPLSIYCHEMLMDSLRCKNIDPGKVLGFFNMVQVHKSMHKRYLDSDTRQADHLLNNYIPFYSEIEWINLTHESIFHQLKESRAYVYYRKLWLEICERMNWQAFIESRGIVKKLNEETDPLKKDDTDPRLGLASNG